MLDPGESLGCDLVFEWPIQSSALVQAIKAAGGLEAPADWGDYLPLP